jgi:RHS repeat-associated protein
VVTQLQYNSQGDLTSSSTPDGNSGGEQAKTSWTYDADGEPLTNVAPDGNLSGANAGNYTTAASWNNDGQQTSLNQGGGTGHTDTPRITSYGHDGDGNQTSVTDARGYATTITYNADDAPVLTTDSDGNATLTCYDGNGNTAQTVPPVGVAANNLTPASCPTAYPAGYGTRLASDATVSTFDADGNKTRQTTPAPAGQSGYETTSYTYDSNGNLLTTTAPPASNGGSAQVTANTWNNAGQLTAQTTGYGTPAAATASYCYDPNGNTTSVVYADGNTGGLAACSTTSPWNVTATPQSGYQTNYAYDSASEMVTATTPATTAAPGGATTACTYDPAGNTLTRIDPNGITTTQTYTPLSQLASASYSGSTAHPITDARDANGALTAMTDATGTSTYSYDPFGELTSAQNGAGQVTGYAYNPDGQISAITYPLPATATWASTDSVTYGYDKADLMTSATDFNGNQIGITDTADALPSSVTLASTGDTISTSYDNTDWPSVIALKNSATTLQSFSYTDAPARNILGETDTPTSSQTPATYTYDAKDRVTSMTPGTGTAQNYAYDPSGNLTTLPGGATGTYDKAGELTSAAVGGVTTNYTYNADGERTAATQGSTTLASASWNGAGQLTAYSNNSASMTAASYDGNGLRAAATTTPAGGSALTQGYVWNKLTAVPQLIMDGTSAYIYAFGNTPAEQVNLASGAITYLVADSLGSVRGTVSSTGTLTSATSYTTWGTPQTNGGLSATTPFGYAGGYTDPTGLTYLLNRYYDPATGQFTSVDPLLALTYRPYAYTAGNPVTGTDPRGLEEADLPYGGGSFGVADDSGEGDMGGGGSPAPEPRPEAGSAGEDDLTPKSPEVQKALEEQRQRLADNRSNGRAQEQKVRANNPDSGPASRWTPRGWRFIDVLTAGGRAIEVKTGRVYATGFVRLQIWKDVWLRQNGELTGVTWDFSPSSVTGRVGPSPVLRELLEKAGIRIVER